MPNYDAIVVGVGGMGSAALYHLAARGMKVLGIDAYGVPNDKGSSFGETRIIRKAYFEHPNYVPLLVRAYDLWSRLEAESGVELFRRTGLLEVGLPYGEVIEGVHRSAATHGLSVESLPGDQVSNRFPGFWAPANMQAVFEADAGFLHVDRCVEVQARLAQSKGASLTVGERVRSWNDTGGEVRVETDRQSYTAKSLVLCAGPWSNSVMRQDLLPLTVLRKPVFWFETRNRQYAIERGCPVFCFDTKDGFYYGCPTLEGDLLKIAEHSGGTTADADTLDRQTHPEDEARIRNFAQQFLPDVIPQVRRSSVCMYTMTPDQHFILDFHPQSSRVAVAAGFSGHGFKFAPIMGSILADFVIEGRTREPCGFLSEKRPALSSR